MFGYRYLILANHCHTALWAVKLTVAQQVTVLFYRPKCCFNKQLSNKHIFTALHYFPTYQRTLCEYTYTTYILSCEVLKPTWSCLLILNEWINYWLWKRSSCLHRDPVGGTWRGRSFNNNNNNKVQLDLSPGGNGYFTCTGASRERWDFVLWTDPVYWGSWEIRKRRLWKGASLSTGAR